MGVFSLFVKETNRFGTVGKRSFKAVGNFLVQKSMIFTQRKQPRSATPYSRVWNQLLCGHFATVFVLFAGILSAMFGYAHCIHVNARDWESQFHTDANLVRNQIRERMMSYELGLEFGRGFVISSDLVSRDEWKLFYNTQSVEDYFPGVMGFGFVEIVDNDDVEDFVKTMRLDGAPSYSVKSPAVADDVEILDQKYLIKYHEPESRNSKAWGLDVAVNPKNRQVYDTSRDLGKLCFSEPIRLFQEGGTSWGLVIASPVYRDGTNTHTVEQRRDAIIGWVGASIGFERFMAAEWQNEWDRFNIEIFSLKNGHTSKIDELVYSSSGQDSDGSGVMKVLRFGELSLGMKFVSKEAHSRWITSPDQGLMLVVGLLITLLVTTITWSITRTRGTALTIARTMTTSLRESEYRQRQLAQEALIANKSKSTFLANMSHEIRTPMTAILGYSEILQENITNETSESCIEAIGAIRRSGEHLMVVINDVLDLSKVESGNMAVHIESCSLVETVEEVYKALLNSATKSGLELNVDFKTSIPEQLTTDTYRVRQILINLVGNAIKYTQDGSVSIVLAAEKNHIRIAIKDTGDGISESDIDSLFVPFVQLGNQAVRRGDSSGLGLSIAHHLAELLGGGIEIESVLGEGSVFTLVLPWIRSSIQTPEGVEMIRSLNGLSHDRGPDGVERRKTPRVKMTQLVGRVLLAEDGPDNQKLITHILTRVGLEVVLVENGQQAVDEYAKGDDFDLVLMDMQMPVMDGYQATRALRNAGCAVPIIALTAHAMASARNECLDAGCDAYIAKPIDRALFYQTVELLLVGKKFDADDHQSAA